MEMNLQEEAETTEYIVSCIQAGVQYKHFALQEIDLQIPRGYITCIEGKNGAGKSTLLRMLTGAISDYTGQVCIDGLELKEHRIQVLQNIGIVSEEQHFMDSLGIKQNEEIYAPYYTNWDSAYFHELLKKFEIPEYGALFVMSKGTYVKYQLAFALAHHPKLLVLDEPTGGLDAVFRREFLELLQEVVALEEITIIMTTHLEKDIAQIGDYLVTMENGRITHQGWNE